MYFHEGFSWPWSYGSSIYSYVYNLCLSITTDVVSSIPAQGEVYNIMW
jgi:hypothetical protein